MDCKKYYNTFWVRLIITLILASVCFWLVWEHNWLWLCIAVPTLAWSVWSFYRLYTYHTRKVAFLLDAIENNDPAVHFYEHVVDKDSSQVNVMLNRIARIVQALKRETVEREKYYELILDFVETGIVVLDEKGVVFQKNRKALELLGLEVLTHVKQLGRVSESVEKAFREILPGQKMQVEYTYERGTTTLCFTESSITIQDKNYRIIACNASENIVLMQGVNGCRHRVSQTGIGLDHNIVQRAIHALDAAAQRLAVHMAAVVLPGFGKYVFITARFAHDLCQFQLADIPGNGGLGNIEAGSTQLIDQLLSLIHI